MLACGMRALPPTCTLPVAGFVGTGFATGPVASAVRTTPASKRSSRPMIAAISPPNVWLVSFTNETSSNKRASGAWRISMSDSPNTSMLRTNVLAPSLRA